MVVGSKYRGGQECISSAVLAWNNIYQCQPAGCAEIKVFGISVCLLYVNHEAVESAVAW